MKNCLIITDDKTGHINAACGLADAINNIYPIKTEHRIYKKNIFIPLLFFKIFPFLFKFFLPKNLPDIIIANGRRSIKINAIIKIYCEYIGKKTFSIQLQKPHISHKYFDSLVIPYHDKVSGDKIFQTVGALNHITKDKINSADKVFDLPDPVVSVLIGGSSSRYKFSTNDANRLADDLHDFMNYQKFSLAITVSRRTGKEQIKILKKKLFGDNIYFYDGVGDNPYFSLLKFSHMAIITADSINMISEAATAGLNILLYPMRGRAGKFKIFYEELTKRGYLQDFSFTPSKKKVIPLNETKRAAIYIVDKIKSFFG